MMKHNSTSLIVRSCSAVFMIAAFAAAGCNSNNSTPAPSQQAGQNQSLFTK